MAHRNCYGPEFFRESERYSPPSAAPFFYRPGTPDRCGRRPRRNDGFGCGMGTGLALGLIFGRGNDRPRRRGRGF